MNYSTRIKIAAVFSLLIHAVGFGLLRQTHTPGEYIPAVAPEPIVLDLQPEAQPTPPPQQFVDVAVPAAAPPQVTEHIAVEDAEAHEGMTKSERRMTKAAGMQVVRHLGLVVHSVVVIAAAVVSVHPARRGCGRLLP